LGKEIRFEKTTEVVFLITYNGSGIGEVAEPKAKLKNKS